MACEQQKPLKPVMPDHLLNESQMVDVLTEMHLANAMVAARPATRDSMYQTEIDYYGAIYKKYGVEEQDFKNSFNYYSLKPVQIDSIYARVIEKLNYIEAAYRIRPDTIM